MAKFIGVTIGFVLVVLLQCAAAQTVHVVGDGIGWTVPSNGPAAYTNWATGKSFAVGDILSFNFATTAHDVLRVSEASYDACNNANPIGDLITTGPVNITLDSTGDHYYICTFSQHCQLGQKLAITVSSSAGTPPGSSPAPSVTPTTPTTPTTPSPTNNVPAADCPTSDPPRASGPGTQNTPGRLSPTSPPAAPSSSSKVLAGVFISVIALILSFMF
ncbi:cucumber peeling cupredoxin [Ricinus communis]|uniref:Blue copper protein, putative n=1 Tax=Ricinus communis TaxID=3988 RepID=B9RV67_RICCO|nr:cucumber peeling cupredoxin [Ricinus communis]EEF44800.1 Blue copper protein precursor, putative [Ricinus communis]|eukprot:XP_002517636.1 cucumber peeling cupredoxin [Ricinus communis]